MAKFKVLETVTGSIVKETDDLNEAVTTKNLNEYWTDEPTEVFEVLPSGGLQRANYLG